jgi:heme-degrading monooxygenase HmoA
MFARVAWGKVRPGTWQDYEQFYHDEVLPKTRDLKGLVFRELLQGADDPNEGISLSLWESREDLDAYERSDVYAGIVEQGRALYVGEFWVKHFDVKLGEQLKREAGGAGLRSTPGRNGDRPSVR